MIKRFLSVVMALMGGAIGYGVFALAAFLIGPEGLGLEIVVPGWASLSMAVILVIIFAVIFFNLTPIMTKQSKKAAANIEKELKGVSGNDLFAGTIGLIMGLIVAYLLSKIYEAFEATWFTIILTVVTYIVCAFIGIILVIKKGPDVFASIDPRKFYAASREKGKASAASAKILDTSVIIDGRIADILRTGFLEGNIIIPEFVLVELRHIADSSDSLKRQRGRRGLDVLNKIQQDYGIEIYNTDSEKSLDEIPEVDVKLLKLAQIMNGKVVTNDFNLDKVAAIQGVEVLNINELANTLKPIVLPGENMTVFLVKEGKEHNQAVAYLDDGTMIVVEDGRKHIGSTVDISVTSVLQTAAGRMIFGRTKK